MNKPSFILILFLFFVTGALSLKKLSVHNVFDTSFDSHLESDKLLANYQHNEEFQFNNIKEEIPYTIDDCPANQILDYLTLKCHVIDLESNSWIRQSPQGPLSEETLPSGNSQTSSQQFYSNSRSSNSQTPSKAPMITIFILTLIIATSFSERVDEKCANKFFSKIPVFILVLIQFIIVLKDGSCTAKKVLGAIIIVCLVIYIIIELSLRGLSKCFNLLSFFYVICSVVQILLQIVILVKSCS